jgi:hypothetical protein
MAMPRVVVKALLGLACALALPRASAYAEAQPGDPYAYDLRLALEPLAFQAGVTQRWFGSAARAELGVTRWLDVALDGRFAWFNADSSIAVRSYLARANFSFHIAQSVDEQPLYGTVYPADTPAIAPTAGTDQDLMGVPVSEKLRSGEIRPLDRDLTLSAAMRDVHSLRLGFAYGQVAERARPDANAWARDRMALLQLGYSYSTHWNLVTQVTGKREIGYRRFFFDAMLTSPGLTKTYPTHTRDGSALSFVPVGARVGMQGAMEGLLGQMPSLGFAYDVELGAYPGRGGIEGYLFLALGVAYDVATR